MKRTMKKDRLMFFSVLLIALAFAVSMCALVWAKYISQEKKDTVVAAQAFYFESDLLTENGATYTLAPGTTKITFHMKNVADELRISDVEINYTVTVNGNTYKEGTLGAKKSENQPIYITGLTQGTYEVVATATSPYAKTLKATFVIPAASNEVFYSVSDAANSPVLRVTVWTEDYSGNVTLSWPGGIFPDNTDPLLANATGTSATVNFENDSEYTFLFFKANPAAVYTEVDIKAEAAN